jgi:hypothetical protein
MIVGAILGEIEDDGAVVGEITVFISFEVFVSLYYCNSSTISSRRFDKSD